MLRMCVTFKENVVANNLHICVLAEVCNFTLSDMENVDATLVSSYLLSVFCFFFVSVYLIVDCIEYIKNREC